MYESLFSALYTRTLYVHFNLIYSWRDVRTKASRRFSTHQYDGDCHVQRHYEDAAGSPGDLLGILAYHVTDGRRFSNSVFNRNNSKMIEMLAGGYIYTSPDLSLSDNQGQEVGLVLPRGSVIIG